MLVRIDSWGFLDLLRRVRSGDLAVGHDCLLQRYEGLLQTEQPGLDRHPAGLSGLIVEVNLADAADPVAVHVDDVAVEKFFVSVIGHSGNPFIHAQD
ncbi:hypothetical protein SDC9_133432 [bioreactor metagenome]|uniref:Uncharacterized protein n=1 Tax=bioreactor metagenome TaxID=1076179 RepID=A0A645DBL8_9ZZZZ